MSKGQYDHTAHRAAASGRATQRREEVFTGTGLDPMLDPKYRGYRESLRVGVYPKARPIMVALDETGSMGHIPHFLATDAHRGLPGMVKGLYPFVADPQICFLGIGDARCQEDAPIQLGHFEGEGHKMDEWLTKLYLENGGGGNGGESYELGLYAGARCVRADAFRDGDRGYHFTVGDDNLFSEVRAIDIQERFGVRIEDDIATEAIMAELVANWHPFFICPDPGRAGHHEANWRRYFGDHVIIAHSHEDIAVLLCGVVGLTEGTLTDLDVFDRLLAESFERQDPRERGRVITVLEAYAAVLGRAGGSRPAAASEPTAGSRKSGNVRHA